MRLFIATFLLALPLFAQPGLPTAPPAALPNAVTNPNLPDIPDPLALHTPKGRMFEQPAMNGDDIAIMYFQLTGKRVLPSQAASQVEIKIVQPGPLANKDIAELIETKLSMEGFALASSPGNPDQLRLVPAAGGNANAKNTGVRVITDASLLPENDQIVAFKMRMNYMKPEEAARIFQSVIGQFGPAGTVVPVPNASSIIITDNALLIRSLIELKAEIDVPSSNVSTRFVDLIFADAEEMAAQLNELVNEEQSTTSSVQRTNPAGAANIPPSSALALAQSQSGKSAAGEDIPLKIVAEPRTNRIVLLGSPDKILFAETLIDQFDQPSSDKNSIRRKLKYLPVAEFMSIASNAIEATLGTNSSGGTSRPNANRANTNQTSSNNRTNTNTGGSSGGGRTTIGGQDGNTAPESLLIGKTLLVADNVSNSIVVNGPPHHIEIVQNLLDELDTRSEQIAITAVFGKYDSNSGRTFSSDIAALFSQEGGSPNVGGGAFNRLSGSIDGIFSSADIQEFTESVVSSGLNIGFARSDFGAFINATKSKSNFREISRPTIFTTNNRSARISSGSRIAVPTGSFTGGSGVGTSTQVEYRDVTLELEVRPLVNGTDEVTLEIALVKDSLGAERSISSGGGALLTQDINSEELSTIVTVADKSLIVLGGLYTDNENDSDNRIPLLGDIPLLGRLFSNQSKTNTLSELVIMVYPQIVSNRNEILDFQREFDKKSYVTPNTRENFHSNALLDEPGNSKDKKPKKLSSTSRAAFQHDQLPSKKRFQSRNPKKR